MESPNVSPADVYTKADTTRRVFAYLIDSVLAGVVGGILGVMMPALGGLVSGAYMLLRDGLDVPYMTRRSLGKQLLNLRVVRTNDQPMDVETSIRRNWTIALCSFSSMTWGLGSLRWILTIIGTVLFVYEIYRVVARPDGRRLGDEQAGTYVVDDTAVVP